MKGGVSLEVYPEAVCAYRSPDAGSDPGCLRDGALSISNNNLKCNKEGRPYTGRPSSFSELSPFLSPRPPKRKAPRMGCFSFGDPAGARTPDNRLKRQVLYLLSYRVRSLLCCLLYAGLRHSGTGPVRGLSRFGPGWSQAPFPSDSGWSLGLRPHRSPSLRSKLACSPCLHASLAGMAGIEPAMRESKSRALTAWLHPFIKPQGRSRCSGPVAFWGGRRDSNPRHSEPQSDALPTELRPPYQYYLRKGPWHA